MGTALPLAAIHQHLRATFREEYGRDVVAYYQSAAEEHRAARRAAGLFDLSHRGLLEILGPDRATWLHNLLTNDIKSLTPGQGCYAALLTPQGKILADGNVLMLPDSLLIDYDPSLGDTLASALAKYKISERVELRDRTQDFGLLAVQGPHAHTIMAAWAGPAACPDEEYEHRSLHIEGIAVMIIRRSMTGDPGFLSLTPSDRLPDLWQQLLATGQSLGLTPCGLDALESLRLEAGIPRYGMDFDETVLLPEAGLEHAVSRTKGCYIGQEFVVRVRDRGHLQRRLALLALEGATPPPRGSVIHADNRTVGMITSSALIPTRGQVVAFGYLHRDCWQPGSRVTIQTAPEGCQATVVTPTITPVEDPPAHRE